MAHAQCTSSRAGLPFKNTSLTTANSVDMGMSNSTCVFKYQNSGQMCPSCSANPRRSCPLLTGQTKDTHTHKLTHSETQMKDGTSESSILLMVIVESEVETLENLGAGWWSPLHVGV